MLNEADRLGLEVNMTNDAGWCGSGGPWIPPELSMQYLVWTETSVEGGKHFDAALPEPQRTANYYRDITVLAFPTPAGKARIANINGKTGHDRQDQPAAPAKYSEVPADQVIKGDTDHRSHRPVQRRPLDVGRAGRASGPCCGSATPRPARSTPRPPPRAAAWNATS